MRARLRIDREACVGSGLCAAMAPELFTLAGDGLAGANERYLADPGRIEAARDVADCCPSGAISVDQDHGTEGKQTWR
ncbi:ferredoxin [Actinomadura terrae]|uniref:ferredoxin n=1 Tax=Actinomadura terrae TaxID=604353 RepID=UPI001FA6E88E|nr:ferredoxin [Actinomadura terrae]